MKAAIKPIFDVTSSIQVCYVNIELKWYYDLRSKLTSCGKYGTLALAF